MLDFLNPEDMIFSFNGHLPFKTSKQIYIYLLNHFFPTKSDRSFELMCTQIWIIYYGKKLVGFTIASWKVRIFSCVIFHETEWLLKKEKTET